MVINVNYRKRKNQELFKSLEDSKMLFLSKAQNYIPIYNRFFSLNDTNYNNINLNHKWYITSVKEVIDEQSNVFYCRIKNADTEKTKDKDVFFKLAPLLDPYKYLIGKYENANEILLNLPSIHSNNNDTYSKFLDVNNCAYVDGFFVFLTSNLIHTNNFVHGVDYYGSFLGIKNNYKLNIFDDLEYLVNSVFFNKNKGILFTVDNYDCEGLFGNVDSLKLAPIKIEHNLSSKSNISIKSINEELFENIFDEKVNHINLEELKDINIDLEDITNHKPLVENENSTTLRSGSSCSSRTSHTSSENSREENEECDNCGENMSEECDNENDKNKFVK
jgi:hypothetical protein